MYATPMLRIRGSAPPGWVSTPEERLFALRDALRQICGVILDGISTPQTKQGLVRSVARDRGKRGPLLGK
jgi:hypothetical protein